MRNLEEFGVQELKTNELTLVNGGAQNPIIYAVEAAAKLVYYVVTAFS